MAVQTAPAVPMTPRTQPAPALAPLGPYVASSPYSVPFGVEPEPTQAKNWMGLAALVLGIVSVGLLGTLFRLAGEMADTTGVFLAWIVVAILAVVFGAMGIHAAGRREATNRGLSIAGMVLGIVMCSFLLLIFGLVIWGITLLR